jgi:hypothetical protein
MLSPKRVDFRWTRWLIPAILATLEAEIGRITVQANSGKKFTGFLLN